MDENVYCIEPNLAIFYENYELKHFNLIWGGWQSSDNPNESFMTNVLLWRTADGQMVNQFMTNPELQTTIDSLDYDGNYFWSVQAVRSTPVKAGWILRKWEIPDSAYNLEMYKFKTFSDYEKASCLAVEWYTFTLLTGIDPTRNYTTVGLEYSDVMERVKAGHRIKIGPNPFGTVFWGTVSSITLGISDYTIEFTENSNASYNAGEDAFVEVQVYVFDTGGNLHLVHPETLEIEQTSNKDEYKNVTACAFSVVEDIPSINVGMKTPTLFYISGMAIYCKNINDLDFILAAQALPLNFYADGNSFIPVYELKVRGSSINAQHYLLQKDYRESRADVGSTHSTWDTYNYLLQQLYPEPAHLILDVQPLFVARSGIAYCSCQVLDTYNFPLSGVEIGWGHGCGTKARFLDDTETVTDANGYSYNRLYATANLDFPIYVTVTGVDISI